MAVTVAELVARLRADVSDFKRGMSDANRTVDQSAARLNKFGTNIQTLGKKLSIGITAPYMLALRAGFRELQEAQKQSAITEAHIKSTGGAANVTAKHVDEMANALQRMSGIDDELIKAGSNMLLTFKRVRNEAGFGNDIFDRATKAALDLSFQFGSTDSAAKQLGKALADPVKGMGALKKAGVDFTDKQKFAIAALMASGDVLGAQRIILGEVESQVGGTAKAYGKTLVGQVSRAKEELKNMAASMLESAAPAIQLLADVLSKVAKFLQGMPDWAKKAFAGLATGAAILGPLLFVVGGIARNLAAIRSLGGAAGAAGAGAAASGGNWALAGAGAGGVKAGGGIGKTVGGALKFAGYLGAALVVTEIISQVNTSKVEKVFQPLKDGSGFAAESFRELNQYMDDLKMRTNNDPTGAWALSIKQRFSELKEGLGLVAAENPKLAQQWIWTAIAAGMPLDKVKKLNEALGTYKLTGEQLKAIRLHVKDEASAKVKALQDTLRFLTRAPWNVLVRVAQQGAPPSNSNWNRQFGGPVAGGRPYIVGEAGPELFVPNHSGKIVPNNKMSIGGGSPIVINIAGSVVSERQLLNVIYEGLKRRNRQSGSLAFT